MIEPLKTPPPGPWPRVVGIAGTLAGLAYAFLFAVPLPGRVQVFLTAVLAFGVIVASLGLARVIGPPVPSGLRALATTANILAAAFMLVLVLWQHAARDLGVTDRLMITAMGRTLAMGWDLCLAAGTVLLGIAVAEHPLFGRRYAVPGAAIGGLLFVLSVLRFPRSNAEAGFPDLALPVGAWYAVIVLRIWWHGRRGEVGLPARDGTS